MTAPARPLNILFLMTDQHRERVLRGAGWKGWPAALHLRAKLFP